MSLDALKQIAEQKINWKERAKGKKGEEYKTIYYDYLRSKEYHWMHSNVLKRDNYKCQMCFAPAQCVHHLTYDHAFEELGFELISLCNSCHKKIHNITDED